jgi:hypothetical protein
MSSHKEKTPAADTKEEGPCVAAVATALSGAFEKAAQTMPAPLQQLMAEYAVPRLRVGFHMLAGEPYVGLSPARARAVG